jgi:hypothetical protein
MANGAHLWEHSRCSKTARMRQLSLIVVALALCSACLAQTGKVEALRSPTDSSLSTAVVKVLDSHGQRLKLPDGAAICDIWLRTSISAQTKKQTEGLLYPELSESLLVGAISFPQATMDYRGQPIAAGTYTLRYELIPDDGNHLGVSPNRDFLLLVPAALDSDPATVFKFDELVSMSRKATGTNHPGPLSLTQASGSTSSLTRDAEDHWIFSGTLKLDSGKDLPFALIVKGTAAQ